MNDNYGELIDESTVRFERLLPGPIERVWSYIVDADKRARWLCGGETELTVGGRVEMLFNNKSLSKQPDDEPPERYRDMLDEMSFGGRVTHCDPPRLLEHTWEFEGDHSEVRYELEPAGNAVRLVLTHRRLNSPEEVLSVCGGWHTHLKILDAVLNGIEPPPFWKTHTAFEDDYRERLKL